MHEDETEEMKRLLDEDEREIAALVATRFKPHPWFDFSPKKKVKS